MQTREIAAHLAEAARHFPRLEGVTQESLLDSVRAEFGYDNIFHQFQPYGTAGNFVRVNAPRRVLHIVSSHTPHAGLRTLIRGLLVGAHNWCIVPENGYAEMARFREFLPFDLARRVEIATELPGDWLEQADAVVVFGSSDTVDHYRRLARADQRFVAHPHRFSFGIVFADPDFASVSGAVQDTCLFDQQGCLSPHVFYVHPEIVREYAVRLAQAMAAFEKEQPRGVLCAADESEILAIRNEFRFRAANHPEIGIWESENSTAWTVLLDDNAQFMPSCLNRVIIVKPLPEQLGPAILRVRGQLSTAGIHPATMQNAERVASLGVTRVCPIGRMQFPPLTWHHDGRPGLMSLVRWIDFEVG